MIPNSKFTETKILINKKRLINFMKLQASKKKNI